jgi:hypothetical protein
MRVRTGRFRRIEKHAPEGSAKAGYDVGRQSRFTWSGAVRPLRSARLALCRRFRPSPCPTHYDGRWATTPSADCWAITPRCCHRVRCSDRGRVRWALHAFRRGPQSGSHGNHDGLRVRWLIHAFQHGPQFDSHHHSGPHVAQLSPNKNMSFQCATAAFTLSAGPDGLRHLVLTRPQTEPSMRFVFLGSHLCARASFRQALAGLPLPSASSYPASIGSSYRIAVGTRITARPPHRTERARFGHSAPALGA